MLLKDLVRLILHTADERIQATRCEGFSGVVGLGHPARYDQNELPALESPRSPHEEHPTGISVARRPDLAMDATTLLAQRSLCGASLRCSQRASGAQRCQTCRVEAGLGESMKKFMDSMVLHSSLDANAGGPAWLKAFLAQS